MYRYNSLILLINFRTNGIPAIPSGDNFTTNGFEINVIDFNLDGTHYNINSYTNGQYFTLYFDKTGTDHVQLRVSLVTYDNTNKILRITTLLSATDVTGKLFNCSFGITSSDSTRNGVPNNWTFYCDFFQSRFDINTSGSNFTVINNPRVNNGVDEYNLRWSIPPSNEFIIRSNSGYKLTLEGISISGGYSNTVTGYNIPSSYGTLSADGSEFRFNSIIENVNYYIGDTFIYTAPYTLFLVCIFTITVVPVQEVNRSVTNNLTHVTNSNSATDVPFNSRYQAYLTPQAGYYVDNVIITMDGVDITSSVYNNGTIDIPNVTGNIIINASGSLNPTLTYNLTNCSVNPAPYSQQYGTRYQATVTPSTGYSLDGASVLITMGGVELFNVYNNGAIDIPSVTDNVTITIITNKIKSFKFKSMNGESTFVDINAVRIRNIKLEINGNTRTLTVDGTVYQWVVVIPQGKQLYGLALTPNADRWIIPLNVAVTVGYNEDITFYEVILDEGEQAQSFSLMLYKNSAEAHRVDKTEFLQSVGTLDGTLRKECSIINPEIDLAYEIVNFNYVFIPIYNRYYFVTDVVYLRKGLVHISLKVDTLMTYKDIIYSQKGLIGRNEFEFNNNLIDRERIIKNDPIIDVIEGNSDFFNPDETGNIVLNVVGGN